MAATNSRLLVIEDDLNLTLALYRALSHSYKVDTAKTGASGLNKAELLKPALIILDLGLPDISGRQILKSLRRSGLLMPVLVLTADGSLDSRVELLDAGADDYLAKPFSLAELQARIRVLLRQPYYQPGSALISGDLLLDPARRQVVRAGQTIYLRRKEFLLLECLLRHAGSCVSRQFLIQAAWGMRASVSANALDVHMTSLRAKIDHGLGKPLIATIHGSGYMLRSPIPERVG